MGDTTGIAWTDSTMNFWEGCTKVGPGCDHCYAEARDIRFNGTGADSHWGKGAPRRLMSPHTRNNPHRWERDAGDFLVAHGHPRRVFCSSLADFFDNEVDPAWRQMAWATVETTPSLRWQICTKRVPNVDHMLPASMEGEVVRYWPRNAGLLVTVVNQEEFDRDVPRLRKLKERYRIPWVGLSVEPMLGPVRNIGALLSGIDWVIIGGESGPHARRFALEWAANLMDDCQAAGVAVFVKQLGDKPTLGGGPYAVTAKGGGDLDEWPAWLRVQQFPKELMR